MRHALAFFVHSPEVVLRSGIALSSSAAVPLKRFGIVLRYTTPLVVHESEIGLGHGIALVRSAATFLHSLGLGGGILLIRMTGVLLLIGLVLRYAAAFFHGRCSGF